MPHQLVKMNPAVGSDEFAFLVKLARLAFDANGLRQAGSPFAAILPAPAGQLPSAKPGSNPDRSQAETVLISFGVIQFHARSESEMSVRVFALTLVAAGLAWAQPAFDPAGTWQWRCCNNRHSGTIVIHRVNQDGTFSGRFGGSADDAATPLSGRVSGMKLEFTRKIGDQVQHWAGTVATEGVRSVVSGTCRGYGLTVTESFQATRPTPPARPAAVAPPATKAEPLPSPQATPLAGQWRWTCCAGAHAGTFTIVELTPEGHFYGTFGSSPSDGATPFAGTLQGDTLVFTRFVLQGGSAQRQQWRARLTGAGAEMSNGNVSGYGLDSVKDFRASKIR